MTSSLNFRNQTYDRDPRTPSRAVPDRTSTANRSGKVVLVGAGPGDPELMTVKGMRALHAADVVVHDRLISSRLMDLIPASVVRIDVGKKPKQHRMKQPAISETLIQLARSGKNVVRLKGGDPFVFGRGHEEWSACDRAGVRCEIVPGISSSLAAPMAAGIPVTRRGVARSFVVVTAESGSEFVDPQHDFSSLANIDTVVVLMGRRTLGTMASRLIQAGKRSTTPVACIEKATTDSERVVTGTLETIAQQADEQNLQTPMVTVIGEVAALSKPLAPKGMGRGTLID